VIFPALSGEAVEARRIAANIAKLPQLLFVPMGGPYWAIANVTPPSNKAVVRPIRADLVMISSTRSQISSRPDGGSFGFFQFPVVAHASKNRGEREDDQSDNAQAKSNGEK